MATYDSLLIDAGGGFIDHNKKSARCKEATVIIGLGGTGADMVIFTGVFFYGNEITYSYDEPGEKKVVGLQNNAMPLGDTGAYQAFLSFRAMDADIKKKIIAETKNRLEEEDSPEVIAAVEKLEANMPKRIARCNMLHDETDPLHEELERFYGEFMKALREFAST